MRGERLKLDDTVLYLHDVVEIYIISVVACQGRSSKFHDNFHVAVFKVFWMVNSTGCRYCTRIDKISISAQGDG